MPVDPALAVLPGATTMQHRSPGRSWAILLLLVLLAGVAAYSLWGAVVGANAARVLWVVPGLVALHLSQLLIAGLAWRSLLCGKRPGVLAFWRLRVVREGIDSVLPVAGVGGEIVGVQLLARRGVPSSRAAASVVVDVTVELLTQILFLQTGLCVLAWISGHAGTWSGQWEAVAAGVVTAVSLLLAQRFGLLRALEALARGIARRWPALAGATLDGLHAEVQRVYRAPAAMFGCVALHGAAWAMGTIESWIVLHLLGVPVGVLQALVIESLGMAARSAGFFIPGAIGVQEGGFVVAALAVGLPADAGLSLSLVKRAREIAVGLIGIGLWRWRPA
ncbi:lysylphosphatidylglycerol synthase domain-containing protein [Lichenicoccus sp.]|uniref:lysylphosphatidylglycerol synthase domain-containing protein n=1 Tax=Lichenicoccus sp. TaxID=2781899 RepID=UPI003D128397